MSNVAILDNRIAYGARCTWWDGIRKVGKHPSGLPCCPHCRGMLFEMENESQWFAGADRYEADGHPGYRAMIEWARGRCFRNMAEIKAAYEQRTS